MDGLNNEERANAWLSSWNPSFDGKAIINLDFSFRAVNQQFCKILDVTPAELIGQKFSDITPEPLRSVEVKNSILVRRGDIQSFLLPKTFELLNGRKVDITLLVNGVYHPKTKQCVFFVATIMARQTLNALVAPSQKSIELLGLDKKTWAAIGIGLGTAIVTVIEKLFKHAN